jgi:uncharacterized protein
LIAKKHEQGTTTVLAVCDLEHLGKSFEEGELFFKVSEQFFGGEKIDPPQLIELIKEADSINFFGDKCTNIAIKEGLISESNVIIIQGVKHAQAYTL